MLGFGFDRDALEQADIKSADAVAAVTGGDNSNIMTARIAHETYEVANVVARIQDPRRAAIYQRLGIATVASVAWATDQVMRRLNPEAHTVEWTDANGAVSMIEVSLPDGLGRPEAAPLSVGDSHRLVAISRGGSGRLATEDAIGQEGDVLHVMVQRDARAELDALLDHGPEEERTDARRHRRRRQRRHLHRAGPAQGRPRRAAHREEPRPRQPAARHPRRDGCLRRLLRGV